MTRSTSQEPASQVARGPFLTITAPHTGRSPVRTGALGAVPTGVHPVFGVHVPAQVPGVPDRILDPRCTSDDQDAYDRQAAKLASTSRENFARSAAQVNPEVLVARTEA